MNISLKWLKSYVDIPEELSAKELAEKITMSIVEIDAFVEQARNLQNIIVAQVKEIKDHPNADKLKVCSVDAGKKGSFKIVCGGNNLRPNMIVALALAGAQVKWHGLGDLVTLENAKIRGVESEGMICAAEEIGLPQKYNVEGGIADLDLDESLIGSDIAEALNLNDVIFEIDNKSLTNRPDLWGHYGIARELSALLNVRFKALKFIEKISEEKKYKLDIKVKDQKACRRYLGVIIDNIKIAPSPDWLVERLENIGLKSINNIVDITNFVMLELGQPLHAFDLKNIAGHQIIVQKAQAGEKFTTLDGVERELTTEDLLICDQHQGVALAGIMGGLNSEIKDDTTSILIESANFEPIGIRKTSVRTGLRTESSARFEKNLDMNLTREAMLRAIELTLELSRDSFVASKLLDYSYFQQESITINLDFEFINKKIGQVIPQKTIISILRGLGFGVKEKKTGLEVEVPSYRSTGDISLPEDLIEEIARIYGYDNIETIPPLIELSPSKKDKILVVEKNIRDFMTANLAYDEVYNYSMISAEDIKKVFANQDEYIEIENAVSKNLKYLRNSLLINLLNNANYNLKYFKEFKIFEIGRVFKPQIGDFKIAKDADEFLPSQDKMLALMSVGKNHFLDFKGDLESLLDSLYLVYDSNILDDALFASRQSLEYLVNNKIIGTMGKISNQVLNNFAINTDVFYAELNVSKLLKYIKEIKKYKALSKYPKMVQDISMIVPDDVLWKDIVEKINLISSLITKVELFDIYETTQENKRKRSLAFHIVFHDLNKTLTSSEVEKIMKLVREMLVKDFKVIIK